MAHSREWSYPCLDTVYLFYTHRPRPGETEVSLYLDAEGLPQRSLLR